MGYLEVAGLGHTLPDGRRLLDGVGVMRQFIGSVRDGTTVEDFLVRLGPPQLQAAWDDLQAGELALMDRDDERTQLAYATALAHWGDAGGYDAEVLWDTVTVAALGLPYDRCKYRELTTLSGGEQKRLALELLLCARSAGSRRQRGSRSCCSNSPARRCCCSTSRPTTSTS